MSQSLVGQMQVRTVGERSGRLVGVGASLGVRFAEGPVTRKRCSKSHLRERDLQ
jgi:hypothetical protein